MNLPRKKRERERAIHNIIKNKYSRKSKASAIKYLILFNVCMCLCMYMCAYVCVCTCVYGVCTSHVHSESGEDVLSF